MRLLTRLRPQPGWKDADPRVRRAAVRHLSDPGLLAEIGRSDPDGVVRREAAEALHALALKGRDEAIAAAALGSIEDPRHLLSVARSAALEAVSRAALGRLLVARGAGAGAEGRGAGGHGAGESGPAGSRALGSVARHGEHAATRIEALQRLADPAEIQAVAIKSPHQDTALAALERLAEEASDPAATLAVVAHHARVPAAARRARAILHERGVLLGAAPPRPRTDRRRQTRMCEAAEALARSGECEALLERIRAAQDAWTDLVPAIDDDLDERFAAAIRAARSRLERNLDEREERERRARERARLLAEHVRPRVALCEMVESAAAEDAPRVIEDAGWEWGRLPPVDTAAARARAEAGEIVEAGVLAEAAALGRRFEAALAECERRHAAFRAKREEAARREREGREEAERAREREERETSQRRTLARLQAMCDRLDRLARAEAPVLRKAEAGLKEIHAAIEEIGALHSRRRVLPSKRDHETTLRRLRALRQALAPRVVTLRESDAWKRWANTGVQEELCAAAEALHEVAEPEEAGRRLRGLQERWRTASAALPERSQELWLRFKAAGDATHARLETHRAEQGRRKEALCGQAEALAGGVPEKPGDWARTADALKRLQAEWAAIGPAPRGREKALWERFRSACDGFFARRDRDLARRNEEWAKNHAARIALCERAEALVDSTDWTTAANTVKRLQADWRAVGPVRRGQEQPTWTRFKAACDRFFERYKRRDRIDLERQIAACAALCAEAEALLPADPPAGVVAGAATPAGAAGPPAPEAAPAPAPPGLLASLQDLRGRWLQAAPPGAHASPLVERFNRALGRVLERFPSGLKGTDFDAAQNRRRMEDLCARVERLMPAGASPEEAALSPATRLAAMLKEALAANTIGGKAAVESRRRAVSEELRKARAAWLKIGYVPEDVRRPLAERFERACRRLSEREDRAPAPRTPDPRRGARTS
jgi:hypothetical protein